MLSLATPALKQPPTPTGGKPFPIARRLDAVAWGLFFVWIGIVLAAGFGSGLGLLGVGLITLGGQAVRKHFDLGVEALWLVAGLLFVLGGVWELLEVQFSVTPVVLIIAGIALLLSATRKREDFTTGRQQ